jgi:iron complex outermembrane receptor protein
MKNNFPLAVLMLSASPFILAQEVKPISSPDQSVAAAQATAPDVAAGPEDIQKVIIVSTGSRGAQRTLIDTAVPVDILSARELNKTGQSTLDKAMQYRVPSFNTVQTPVNDATSLLDPYEIRNMGPSRVLILINGKRKNASSLIYTQTSPGRGESGADISAIPTDAIKRIEVLRDGASAQYGSDAIAGVVNIILKDNPEGGSVTARGGVTHEGDGENAGLSLNHGVPLGDNGFINYTLEASKTKLSNRPGIVNAAGDASDFGGDLKTQVLPFLAKYPDARNINGAPQTETAKGLVNARYDLGNGMAIYGNAAYVHKKVDSYANFRTPYWRPTDYGLLHAAGTPYEGYGPTFIGKLDDYNATGGIKGLVAGWNADLSLTYGGNEQKYDVTNTVNRGMEDAVLAGTSTQHSPTSFKAGGVKFEHWVLNGDISKQITPTVNVYAGTEIRHENYEVKAGQPESYILGGADSYAGNSPENSFPSSRSNYGVYGGASWDITDRFMIDGTGRYEKYTDFGSAFVWKVASRFKVNDQITVRGSASTGFRAPSLAQTFTQKAQYSFVAGSGIQVSGLVNNVSPEAKALQVPALKAEKSDNFTVGLGLQPDSNTSITVDYYNIKVKNRIVLGKEIKPICDTALPSAAYTACVAASPLDTVMVPRGLVSLSFFVNALTSRTSGIDYVLSRKNIPLGEGKVTLNLSGNYSLKNERQGEVNNPTLVANAGQSVLDATQEALMFTSRPKFKTIFGADLDYQKLSYSFNNTVFGPTRFRNAGLDDNLQVAFKTKVVSDFGLTYQFNKATTFSLNVNNIFNVTPKWHFNALNPAGQAILDSKVVNSSGLTPTEVQTNLVTFNGRYSMVTYDGSQFSQLGRIFAASVNYRF